MEHNNKLMMAVVGLVIGVLVGAGAGYAIGHGKSDTSSSMKKSDTTSSTTMMSSDSDGVTVGGAKMVRTKDIVDNAANAKNVSTVVSLVQKAGLVDTLKSPGPFTVFGPNNDAFAKLPAATVASLQEPANVGLLKTILTYHVVPGTYTSADLRVMAGKGEGLTTVQGGMIYPVVENNELKIKDVKGNIYGIETADVISSNGVTHVIDGVLMPQ